MPDSPLSLLPPLVAIMIAIWRKNALIALLCGLFLCVLQLEHWQPINAAWHTITGVAQVFSSTSNAYIVGFSLLIGALVALMNESGAVQGFINHLAELNIVKNSRHAAMLPTLIGTSIFTDTNLSMFTGGMASQQLFDKHQLSRARLAYLLDSTCAPISILFLINGWGAYLLGLLSSYQFADPITVLLGTIYYNFYAIIAVLLAYYTAYSGRVFGAMKTAESKLIIEHQPAHSAPAKARVMWLPMSCLLAMTFVFLWITGNGDIRQGSGSFSVFWAIISALVLQLCLIRYYRLLAIREIISTCVVGIKQMAPAVSILVLSFAFGEAIKALGTGSYVSQLLSIQVPLFLMAPILFLAASLMSFATGTSWGTFAILIPIAVPISLNTGLPPSFIIAAVLSGGIFGDHASPISDTTIVASIASGCDHFEHVKTQLPYAIVGGTLSMLLFAIVGFWQIGF